MHNHFDKNLNLKEIILTERPSHIVECGAGEGDLTKQIISLKTIYPFKFTVISDHRIDVDADFKCGISYLELEKLDSIDLCIIDTDHNYWTLSRELKATAGRLSEGGLIVMHDVNTFYHDTGMALSYSDGTEYPREEIESCGKEFGGLGDSLIDFLSANKSQFRLIKFMTESHGVAVIKKQTVSELKICVPGEGALYAKN